MFNAWCSSRLGTVCGSGVGICWLGFGLREVGSAFFSESSTARTSPEVTRGMLLCGAAADVRCKTSAELYTGTLDPKTKLVEDGPWSRYRPINVSVRSLLVGFGFLW